ncbi:MAG: hypothetical protein JO079_05590 [Frankiaceae bacterium]|nr:hypothetical protein [Frankiaceae bacterium]MBV9368894.1 hypothetical protein [Frankiales bacterium]
MATAATGFAGASPVIPAQACDSSPTYAGGGWLAFRPAGLGAVTAQTSVTYAPDRIFATDGTNLSRTDTGGCHWTTLTMPATPLVDASPLPVPLPVAVPPGTPHINAISAPSTATSVRFVYLAADLTVPQTVFSGLPSPVAGTQAPATQPYVYVSSNSGVSFQAYHSGLPTLGTVTDIAAAPSTPNIAYADVVDSAGSKSGLYRSTDFGQSWTFMSSNTPKQGTLKVNPAVSTSVFGEFADGLEVSYDSGTTFAAVSDTKPTSSYDVASGAGYIQLVQGFSDSYLWERSTNGGNTFVANSSPVQPTRVATSALANTVFLGSDKSDWLAIAHGRGYVTLPVTPSAGPLSPGVTMGAPVGVQVSASGIITPNESNTPMVARLVVQFLGSPKVDVSLQPVQLLHHIGVQVFPSTLYPGKQTVTLPPGAHKDVTYQLLMPRTPSPVDLMYLVDTTSSTDLTLNAVRQDLGTVVNDLGAVGLDSAFGVAEFRDYPPDDFGNGESTDYPYKLRRVIGPANASLRAALNQLKPSGGGDLDEAALTALFQSTTGAGQTLVNVDNKRRQVIAPGLSAQYRPGSLRLAIVASDAGYHKEPDYPTPSWSKTVAALRNAGVHQVGLAVQTMSGNQPTGFDSLHDMQAMAIDTGALAPIGGVDCNGDGQIDVPQGDPLVCKIPHPAEQKDPAGNVLPTPPTPPIHLADALVQLTANIPDLAGVGLRISGGPASVASVVSVPAAPIVNVRADNTLSYTVRYSCPVSTSTHRWSLSLEAVAGVRPLTSTATDLACGAKPKPLIPPPTVTLPAIAVAAAAPAVPPNPPAQGTGNANPNPAVNANAGFAQQEDQQRQLAFADADQGFELGGATEDETVQMSRRPSRDDTGFVAGAAGLMMTGFAAAYARRRKTRPEYARAYR